MAMEAEVGILTIDTGKTAGQTQAVSGLGFQPKILLYWWNGATEGTDSVTQRDHTRGFGYMISGSDRGCNISSSDDLAAKSDTYHRVRDECCVMEMLVNSGGGRLDFYSFDSDGFTVEYDAQFTNALKIGYLALGGASLTNVKGGTFNTATATGTQSYTGVGFQPDFMMFLTQGRGASLPMGASDSMFNIGMASSASAFAAFQGGSNDNQATSDTHNYCIGSECLAVGRYAEDSPYIRADLYSFDSDGWTLDYFEVRTTAYPCLYIAMKGGNYLVGNLLTKDDGTDIVESGFGFEPSAVLLFSGCESEHTTDTLTTEDRFSVGAFSATDERNALGMIDVDNLADTEIYTAIEHDGVFAKISTGGALDAVMDVKSIDSGGFTCVMDDPEGSGNSSFVPYAAFGPRPTAPTNEVRLQPKKIHEEIPV